MAAGALIISAHPNFPSAEESLTMSRLQPLINQELQAGDDPLSPTDADQLPVLSSCNIRPDQRLIIVNIMHDVLTTFDENGPTQRPSLKHGADG